MAVTKPKTAAQTKIMNRFKALKNKWIALDTPANAQQAAAFNPMSNQGWISNIQPWDVSFWNWSQVWQGSAYNMYPTWSYDQQFARYWDPLQTGDTNVDAASNQLIWQYAQYERALTPYISKYQDTAAQLNTENIALLNQQNKDYQQGNQRMQWQSDQYFQWVRDYNQSQQAAQQAFAANEARRATGSQQAATAASTRVQWDFSKQNLDAQSQQFAQDKSLLNELTTQTMNYINSIKWSKDQYQLDTAKQLLDLRNQLASQLTNSQNALVSAKMWAGVQDVAAQRALVRQQALDLSQAQLKKQYG